MTFLIVDTYYPAFLLCFYERYPDLASSPYVEQWRALMDQCYGTADFYSFNLNQLGHEATEVVLNCEPLQRCWAREHGIKTDDARWTRKLSIGMRRGFIPWPKRVNSWAYPILTAQVKHYRPDVLYIQDMNGTSPALLSELRPFVRLIIGQIACPITRGVHFGEYDLVLSSFPHFVKQFQREGLNSEYFKLGFEPKILKWLQRKEPQHKVVFVGGISTAHKERIRLLEAVAETCYISIWGYGANLLERKSPIRDIHRGYAWGLDMYNVLCNADIVLNNHISVAGNYANNMRLYEAAGVGTFLITDSKENLNTLFEPGKELVSYRSSEECVDQVTYYLEHEDERNEIARAGQARTLREHTYYQRMEELIEIVTPLLRQKSKRRRDASKGW